MLVCLANLQAMLLYGVGQVREILGSGRERSIGFQHFGDAPVGTKPVFTFIGDGDGVYIPAEQTVLAVIIKEAIIIELADTSSGSEPNISFGSPFMNKT